MATITVSSSTTLALLSYAADDDIVITGAATLTVDSNPTALPAIRSIRSSSPRATLKVRNSATAFTAGNLWRLSFTNPGSAIGAGQATLGFTAGATMDFEGEWLTCYTATGAANETVLDASNVLGVDIDFPYFIEAETAVGSNVYRAVPVAVVGGSGDGFLTTVDTAAFGTGDVGRVLFYNRSTRLLQTGNGTNGSLFAAGIKFRIPNIYIHMPAFTMTVATGGWTTGTGAQNVNANTNAPIRAAGSVNYTAGVECFNISALPSGTTVTVNNRGSDGTTATAFPAGTLLYAVPQSGAQMAGRISISTNGIFKSRCALFGRWLYPHTSNGASWVQTDTGITTESDYNIPMFNNILGLSQIIRGVVYANHARGLMSMMRFGQQLGEIDIDGPLCVASASAVSSTSHFNGGNPLIWISGVVNISRFDNVRVWRLGYAAGMSNYGLALTYQTNAPQSGRIQNLETVGGTVSVATSNVDIVGWRFSQTNGFATTAFVQAFFGVGGSSGAVSQNVKIYDFDLLAGGVFPYGSLFDVNGFSANVLIHNKISGTPRTIDCQTRPQTLINGLSGNNQTLASMYFVNTRGSGQGQLNAVSGVNSVVRNVRIAHPNSTLVCWPKLTLDFPPAPLSGNVPNQYTDSGTFYAAPNTYPSLAGGIYLGPVTREQDFDQYELTGGAYTNNSGNFFIETAGDVVLFKSPKRIAAVSAITGGAVVYAQHSNITTGVTAEFRLCKWGDDITAVSWGSFTGANVQTAFNALSGYTSSIGLNLQLRFTATTTVAGRFIRQCYVPCQMDTAYNPAVGTVNVTALGAANGGLMVVYDGSNVQQGTATIASGTATVPAPYDFDGSATTYRLKIRALQNESVDITSTYTASGALVPAPMTALTGYIAGPYPGASFNKGTKTVTITSNMTAQQLWSAWREYIVQLVNFDVEDVWTYPELNAGTWEIAFSGAGSLTGSYTDRNGTRAPISAPNLPVGTRVQFYDVTNSVQLSNEVLTSAGAETSLYFTSPVTVRLRAAKLGELPIEAFGVLNASGLTFIDEFVTDSVYNSKGIDGSTVTEFTADEPNVQIDSDDPDGVSSVWRCYAWWRYYETLSLGIAGALFGKANAVDTENLAINASIQLDNVNPTVPLKLNDGYMYRVDGVTVIAAGSGSIQMDPKKAYSASGGSGGATPEEIWTYPQRKLNPEGGVTILC